MGFRFRKSFKIAPGVRMNVGKKGVGVSVGPRGAKVSVNSSGRVTKSVGIPGTGGSYVESSTIGKSSSDGGSTPPQKKPSNSKVGTILNIICKIVAAIMLFLTLGMAFSGEGALGIIFFVFTSLFWCLGNYSKRYYSAAEKMPDKKRKSIIMFGVGAVIIIAISAFFGVKPENITAEWSDNDFYVGDSTEVHINVTPENANISNLKISENDIAEMEFKDSVAIVTFTAEGKADISFVSGDAESNIETITVIAKKEEKKTEEKSEEKEAKKEPAKPSKQTEASNKKDTSSESKAPVVVPPSTPSKEPADTSSSSSSSSAKPETPPAAEETVYITNTGGKYHRDGCRYLDESKHAISLSSAKAQGYVACKVCH